MERLRQSLPFVCIYLDDILLMGRTNDGHACTIEAVLNKLEKQGYGMSPEVEYLGHIISKDGIRPTEEKVKAILNAPQPQNVISGVAELLHCKK